MSSIVFLMNRCVRNTFQISNLLIKNNINNNNNYVIYRGFKLWQEKTLKLMYHRNRLFKAVPHKHRPRSVRQEWNFKSELFAFSQRLNENLSEENLKIAFANESYIQKEEKQRKELGIIDVAINIIDNNNFATVGETICKSYIKPYLRHFLPRLPEDGIIAIYDYLMSEEVLSDIAKWIGCIDLVLCEEFPPNHSTLAKTVKALVGALAKDQNEKRAENFVLDFILTYLADKDLLEIWEIPNPSLNLKRILNRERLPAPEPRLLRESATGTIEACYVVGIYVNKELIGSAPGETVEIAQSMAEHDALKRIFNLTPSAIKFLFGPKAYNLDFSESQKETLYLKEWTPSLLKNEKIQFINTCV